MRIQFFGATETVTGSKYLVEAAGKRILVDCGLFQGASELRARNWDEPPFDPTQIDAVLLTHAHIDHIGYLPLIVRRGYRGPVYASDATCALIPMLLTDSAELQQEEARFAEREHSSRHHPPKPLYDVADAKAAIELLRPFSRLPTSEKSDQLESGAHGTRELFPGMKFTTACAGHILGSVAITLQADGKSITFSGDIGRYDAPLLPDPQPIALGDLVVCESTYGDRDHSIQDPKEVLAAALKRGIARRGAIIIPAFAVGRTQTLLSMIKELELESRFDPIPVYVDSPMAVDTTEIYQRFKFDFDHDAQRLIQRRSNPLATLRTTFVRSSAESKRLNSLSGSRIIISASGMVTGGRVLHHMMHWLPDDRTTVLFVGYQAQGTRGAQILAGNPTVKMYGRYVPVRAQIESLSGLSAHGDRSELLRWLKSCSGTPSLARTTHGEAGPARAFAQKISAELGWSAQAATYEEAIEL